jgi:hypothetical protein
MNFLFILLRIKGLYMFRALLAHPQEALYTNGTTLVQPTDITRTYYTKCSVYEGKSENKVPYFIAIK